eukprot:69519_1
MIVSKKAFKCKKISVEKATLKKLPQYIQGCYSSYLVSQLQSVQKIKDLLEATEASQNSDSTSSKSGIKKQLKYINAVINCGVLTQLMKFLDYKKYDKIRYNTVCILTVISSGTSENVKTLIKYNVIPKLLPLLQSKSDTLKTEVIWTLGNIAGDSVKYRDILLSYDILIILLPLFQNEQNLSVLRMANWLLQNLCRGKPMPKKKYTNMALQALQIMIKSDDVEILRDACYAIGYLAGINTNNETEKQQVNEILQLGFGKYLIDLFSHLSEEVRHTAI